jgi:RNA polymerase sigma-70 factor (ECF subfamily)
VKRKSGLLFKEKIMDNGERNYTRFLQGDKEGFIELIEEFENSLILFINSFVNDYHYAEEISDEVFLKLYTAKPRFRGDCAFRTWLYAMAKNIAVNYMKKHKKSKLSSLDDYFYLSDETDIEAEYIKSEDKAKLNRAIQRLKPEYLQVLHLIFFEELDNSQVARIMGKTNKQISDIIYRAKNALKAEMGKEDKNEQTKKKG